MPRLRPSLLRAAHRLSPHAAVLLPVCRSIPSALSELRWIREHADTLPQCLLPRGEHRRWWRAYGDRREELTARLCRRRGRGEPLQYILGTQPFGELEIKCRPGVLIPRPETEAYTVHLADLIRGRRLHALSSHPALQPAAPATANSPSTRRPLRILDLCTGTGCIPLLLLARLGRSLGIDVEARGLDVSASAVLLARDNAAHNRRYLLPPTLLPLPTEADGGEEESASPTFALADVFWHDFTLARSLLAHPGGGGGWDVVTCNPPYVSEASFARETARSVRDFEPKAANVPLSSYRHRQQDDDDDDDANRRRRRPEDVFYPRVMHVAAALARARVVLLEVGDLAQARRVAGAALRLLRGERFWQRRRAGDGDDDDPGLVGEGVAAVDVEIWRDWPDASTPAGAEEVDHVVVDGVRVPVKGSGHGRAVLVQLDYEPRD
ncbi:hypothetical protein RB594_000845 [Gaeumannomyces avenae]